jgi:cytidyltransferase-like protein
MDAQWDLRQIRDALPAGNSVTLVGGAFDLLHVGHVRLLEHSKNLGGTLVVAVLSDTYIASYKGSTRPIIPQHDRLQMVAALRVVDHAFIALDSGYDDRTLETLKPSRLVFGTEPGREVHVRERIEDITGRHPQIEISRLDRYPDLTVSTSAICARVLRANLGNGTPSA